MTWKGRQRQSPSVVSGCVPPQPDHGELSECAPAELSDGWAAWGEAAAPVHVEHGRAPLCGVVFSSPHSGRAYFPEFVQSSRLTPQALRASEDAYVDDLFRQAADFGATVLSAVAPRAFIDVNRAPADLDPVLIDGASPRPANARVVAGLGVIPRIVAEGVPIYNHTLPLQEALSRIERWHAPYHDKLVELLLCARRRCGKAVLIDCHSMPSGAMASSTRRANGPVDIVLGDRFGVSSENRLMDLVERAFIANGFRVARNAPFAGGYITERYGRPAAGVSAIQIEIDRGIYLDQTRVTPNAGFEALRRSLRPVIEAICRLAPERGEADLVAAE